MYTLYTSPGTAGMMVHQLLIELGAPYEMHLLDIKAGDQRKPEYLALNPNGVVPTLVIDGKPRTESSALVMLLAERHPEGGFAPAPGDAARDDYLEWMLILAHSLQPAYRLWFYPSDLGDVDHDAIKAGARAKIEKTWDRVEARLSDGRPYMLGDAVSALDFYTLMLMRWSRNMPKPATTWTHLAAFAARMKQRPSWRRLYELEGLTEWA
ncbi:glutathione S-transferase family protein [Tahibacter soli]|jgi:glutathione S-transferase|uniref:Glutathione S-transferase family protein n=1 Tax=Tahibacter soli TaxID=2983605 RepID=A0A9X3YM42_9GAMM|nr:glutathione S-transferase family protein [Tahibacter soli]MDC8014797.1 glutathione S-transferase family protein [Tahibacter soli]